MLAIKTVQISLLSRPAISGCTRSVSTVNKDYTFVKKNPSGSLNDRTKATDRVIGQDEAAQSRVENASDKITEQRVKQYNKNHQGEGTADPLGNVRKFSTYRDAKQGAQEVSQAIKEGAKYAKDSLSNSNTAETIKDTVQEGYKQAKNAAADMTSDDVRRAARETANAAYNGMQDMKREADRATSTASTTGSNYMDYIKDSLSSATKTAKDVMNSDTAQNISAGIKDTAQTAWQKVKGAMAGAVAVAEQKAKAHDPSVRPYMPKSVQPNTAEAAEQHTKQEGKDYIKHGKL